MKPTKQATKLSDSMIQIRIEWNRESSCVETKRWEFVVISSLITFIWLSKISKNKAMMMMMIMKPLIFRLFLWLFKHQKGVFIDPLFPSSHWLWKYSNFLFVCQLLDRWLLWLLKIKIQKTLTLILDTKRVWLTHLEEKRVVKITF